MLCQRVAERLPLMAITRFTDLRLLALSLSTLLAVTMRLTILLSQVAAAAVMLTAVAAVREVGFTLKTTRVLALQQTTLSRLAGAVRQSLAVKAGVQMAEILRLHP
jgi:hypothetical protein